jgi:uncharacterized membrane protein
METSDKPNLRKTVTAMGWFFTTFIIGYTDIISFFNINKSLESLIKLFLSFVAFLLFAYLFYLIYLVLLFNNIRYKANLDSASHWLSNYLRTHNDVALNLDNVRVQKFNLIARKFDIQIKSINQNAGQIELLINRGTSSGLCVGMIFAIYLRNQVNPLIQNICVGNTGITPNLIVANLEYSQTRIVVPLPLSPPEMMFDLNKRNYIVRLVENPNFSDLEKTVAEVFSVIDPNFYG